MKPLRSGLLLTALVSIAFSLHPTTVLACLCFSDDPGYAWDHADAVFLGTVLEETILKTFDHDEVLRLSLSDVEEDEEKLLEIFGQMRSSARWKVRVDEAFKGVDAGETVYLFGAAREYGSDCDRSLSVGSTDLLYVSNWDASEHGTKKTEAREFAAGWVCDRSRDIQRATYDLHWLRTLRRRPLGGYIFGTVTVDRRLAFSDERWGAEVLRSLNEGKIRVELRADQDVIRTALIDDSNRFGFEDLGAGRYEVAVVAPPSLDPDPLIRVVWLHSDHDAIELGFPPGSNRGLPVTAGGRVQGRVLDLLGRPAPGFLVMGRARTDREGRFTVQHVRPADYTVDVRLDDTDDSDKSLFHYPGTPNRAEAALFTVRPGGIMTVGDITLPIAVQPCAIQGIVVDADSQPVAGADVWANTRYGYPHAKTGDAGMFSMEFSVHQKRRLVACLIVSPVRGHGMDFFGASATIPQGVCPTEPVQLQLEPTKECP